jgi:hypothetical protein
MMRARTLLLIRRSRRKVEELEIRRGIAFLCQRNLTFGEEKLKRREDGRFEEMVGQIDTISSIERSCGDSGSNCNLLFS